MPVLVELLPLVGGYFPPFLVLIRPGPVGIWKRWLTLIHSRWTPVRLLVSRICSRNFSCEKSGFCMTKQRRQSPVTRAEAKVQ